MESLAVVLTAPMVLINTKAARRLLAVSRATAGERVQSAQRMYRYHHRDRLPGVGVAAAADDINSTSNFWIVVGASLLMRLLGTGSAAASTARRWLAANACCCNR
ncbi:hypothetical protein TASIC1_0015025500 [Trichoderma asperellum]|uniref:Uncharacterized protein n=1 Tax=Trichoderma asperellum TaxID=101201 RepID=A0A6V8R7K9_TRIAP|nr:hypothetical protein TASIC1_0015025500 [Trichoderma asperellum]